MIDKIDVSYVAPQYQEEYKELIDKKHASEHKAQMQVYHNAVIAPFSPNVYGSSKGKGGVFDEQGNFVTASQTKQEGLMLEGTFNYDKECDVIDETVIWGGYFIKQWGHFLVDVLPRFWWVLNNHYNYDKIVFVVANPSVKISGSYAELLQLIGIDLSKIIIITKETKCREIFVPELSLQRPDYYTEEFRCLIEFIKSKADDSMANAEKVYFTRTRMRKAKNTEINEKSVEKFFAKNGYKIMSPERLTFYQQLSIYVHCKSVAALCGTITHNIIFANENAKWIVVNKTMRINVTQLILAEIAGAECVYIDAYIQPFPVSPGGGPFWIDIGDELIRYAADKDMKLSEKLKHERKGMFARSIDLCRYCLKYFQLEDSGLDIGGEIVGYCRPKEENEIPHCIYFDYRNKIGKICKSVNPIIEIARQIKRKIG